MKIWQVSRVYHFRISEYKFRFENDKFKRQLELIWKRYNLPNDDSTDEITFMEMGANGNDFCEYKITLRIQVLKRAEVE